MAHLFATVVLLTLLACVASANFMQFNYYSDSSCSTAPTKIIVNSITTNCSTLSCSANGEARGTIAYQTLSCPSSLTSGIPKTGTYVVTTTYTTTNCAASSATSLEADSTGVCNAVGGGSIKYTCNNNNPGYILYTDAACSANAQSAPSASSCSTSAGVSSYSACTGAASGLTASISLIAGAIFAVVALVVTQ